MSTALATVSPDQLIEQVVIHGDLSKLDSAQRVQYYNRVCESLGLNPLTKPFEYIKLQGKETLYAKRDATDQLRRIHAVSITGIRSEQVKDVYIVTANARCGEREDSATGAVTTGALSGDNLANALMKAETKAKRRVTLSICGLGFLDELELETIKEVKPVQGSLRDRVMKQVVVDEPKAQTNEGSPAHSSVAPAITALEWERGGELPDVVSAAERVQQIAEAQEEQLDWQRGLVAALTLAPKPTKKGGQWGDISFEMVDGTTIKATWFGFSEPWTYESIREQLCGRTIQVEFVLETARDSRYKPTLQHFRCEMP